MVSDEDIITRAKLEIEGEWYETIKHNGDYKCQYCDMRKKCHENINVYKICRQLEESMYFKKFKTESELDDVFQEGR